MELALRGVLPCRRAGEAGDNDLCFGGCRSSLPEQLLRGMDRFVRRRVPEPGIAAESPLSEQGATKDPASVYVTNDGGDMELIAIVRHRF